MLPRAMIALALIGLIASACSAEASPSARASGAAADSTAPASASSAASAVPSASESPAAGGPPPSAEPIAREPLPAPELTSAEDIGLALSTPQTRLQGVVSLLDQLEIGTYTDAGEPITPGAELDGGTLWLTESEVHALAEMAAAEHPRDFVEFRDWHAGLVDIGLEMSVDELVAAYEEAYYAEFEPPFFVNVMFATGLDLHSEGLLTHLQTWLLFLDGFVVGAEGLATDADPGVVLASHHEAMWGGASAHIPRPLFPGAPLTPDEMLALVARLEPLVRATPLWFEPPRVTAHEGHDAPGDETTLTLRFAPQSLPNAAADLGFVLLPMQQFAGLPVTFVASEPGVLEEHGTMRDRTGSDPFARAAPLPLETDSWGVIELRYTPRQEEADGAGEVSEAPVVITANVPLREIARHTWALPDILYGLLHGDRSVEATLNVEWHETQGIRVEMVDEYDVTLDLILGVGHAVGTDTFNGFLALQEDGTYRGIITGSVSAEWRFDSFESCATSLSGTQELLAIAEPIRSSPVNGATHGIRLYPIAPPQLGPIGCDYTLPRWPGDDMEDPNLPRGSGIPAQDYAPFNDLRVTDPEITRGVPARVPSTGSQTLTWEERLEGIGGGTWTVTVEVVEPDR